MTCGRRDTGKEIQFNFRRLQEFYKYYVCAESGDCEGDEIT